MKISGINSYYNVSHGSSVFADIQPKSTGSYVKINNNQTNADSFSKQKKPLKINKKLVIGAAVAAGVVILAAIAFKKSGSITKTANNIKNDSVRVADRIEDAKKFITEDSPAGKQYMESGFIFHGKNSPEKEQALESFINSFRDSGYIVEQTPRYNKSNFNEIENKVNNFFIEARQRYDDTKTRSLIVIRDLDQLAPNRNIQPANNLSRNLLDKTEKCAEKGYAWIGEAVDIKKIDPSVIRAGRVDRKFKF